MTTSNITPDNWEQFSDKIHCFFMCDMGISMGSTEEMAFLGLEYAGEAGELANELKKAWRDGMTLERRVKIEGELADNIIMLHHLCQFFDVKRDEVAARKIEELFHRWPLISRD